MRFGAPLKLACTALLALSLAGCMAPAQPSPGVFNAKTLRLRPFLTEGSLRTLALVNPKTAADIATLEVIPYVHVGNDVYWPLSPLTGEATDSADPESILKVRREGFDPAGDISLTGLRPQSRYRILARAYDASASIISTEDARSTAEVSVSDDNRPTIPVALPLALVDTSFATTRTLSFQLTGSPFLQMTGSLFKLVGETEEEVPNSTFTLTQAQASGSVTFTNLEAQTAYRLRIRVLDEDFVVMTTVTHDVAIANDDAPADVPVPIDVP